jgi:putative transposase
MARHTTFRFCLDPTVEQSVALARHVGAARFGYNQCLRLHLDARERHRALIRRGASSDAVDQARDAVPWSRFSLINAYNHWKVSQAAGRRFQVAGDGVAEVEVTGLAWRGEVSSQVFEEAAVDLGHGLARWIEARRAKRKGRPAGHPRFKKKNHTAGSFRMRNKITGGGDRQAAGPVINVCRRDGTGPHTRVGETSPDDAGTPVQTAPAA